MSHLSLDELGDVDAVAGHPHLAGCAPCRALLDEQRAVRDLLGSLPGPGAAPPDVVHAIEAALREGAAARTGAASARPGATVTPLLGADAPHWRTAARARTGRRRAAAAGKLLLGVAAAGLVVTGVTRLPAGGGGGSASSAGGATSDSPRAEAAGGTSAAASTAEETAAGRATVPLAAGASATRYSRAALVRQVRSVLEADLAARPDAATAGRLQAAVAAAGGPSDLRGCLRRVGATGTPVAADVGTYDARPAAVVVVRDGRRSTVWVVTADCTAARGSRLATAPLP